MKFNQKLTYNYFVHFKIPEKQSMKIDKSCKLQIFQCFRSSKLEHLKSK